MWVVKSVITFLYVGFFFSLNFKKKSQLYDFKIPCFVYSHFTCWDGRKCRICSRIFQRWCDTQNPKVTVSVSPQEKQGRWFVEGPEGAPVPWKQVAQHRTEACLQGIFVDIQEMHKSKTFPPCRSKRHLQYNNDWRGDYLHSWTGFTPLNVSFSDRKVFFSFIQEKEFFMKKNACCDFSSHIFNSSRSENELYVTRLVKSHQPTHSQLSEIGQWEQFLHFDKSL